MKLFSSPKLATIALVASLFACTSSDPPSGDNQQPNPNAPNPGDPPAPPAPNDPNNPVPNDPNTPPAGGVNPIQGVGAPKLLTDPAADGQTFFDGPVWYENALYISNYGSRLVVKYFPALASDPFSVVRSTDLFAPVGATLNRKTGEFLTVEVQVDGPSQIVRNTIGAAPAPVAVTVTGPAWNSPNDIAVRSDGTIYVTDPGYQQKDEVILNRVYRVAKDGTSTTLLTFNNAERPNGLAFSADEKTFYLTLTATGQLLKYDVASDGALKNATTFANLAGLNPDGITLDKDGNLYVSTNKGVDVFAPDGKKWGRLSTGKTATATAFGGQGLKTLFVTADGAVYQFDNLQVAGR